jgi:hypothetical protein
MQIEVYSTCNLGASNCSFLPQTKKVAKKIEVRLYSNIGLTQMDEGRDKKNGVQVQIAYLDLIVKKKTLEKRVDRNPKAPLEKIFKNHDLTGTRVGVALPFRRPPAAELLAVKQPHADEVVEGPHAAPGLLPLFRHQLGPFLGVTLRH